jgi:ketosteroid isomerase-like protein
MKKILISSVLVLAMLFACEKDGSKPDVLSETADVETSHLKSAVNKNAVITDQVKECLRGYFDGMETRDWDLLRSLVTEDYLVLEQGELFDIEGHINWLQEVGPEPVRFSFTLTYEDVLVKGTTAWAVYFDHLDVYVGDVVVSQWDGLESAVFQKTGGEWKMAMMTATQIPAEE